MSVENKIAIKGGGINEFIGPAECHQFMQLIQDGQQPPAARFLKPSWSYKLTQTNGNREVELFEIKSISDNRANLRQKLSQMRSQRMNRQAALKQMEKSKLDPKMSAQLLDMYKQLQPVMPVLHPTEALRNREKLKPVIQDLCKEYAPNHPLTAYYNLLLRFIDGRDL